MVFKTVILSVRELKSKNSNCLSGHSPQPREPGLPDCLQRLLSHCVLFKVRKHTHTQTMWHHSAQMCVRAWWRFTCSTLTQICQRTVGNGCVCVQVPAHVSLGLYIWLCASLWAFCHPVSWLWPPVSHIIGLWPLTLALQRLVRVSFSVKTLFSLPPLPTLSYGLHTLQRLYLNLSSSPHQIL